MIYTIIYQRKLSISMISTDRWAADLKNVHVCIDKNNYIGKIIDLDPIPNDRGCEPGDILIHFYNTQHGTSFLCTIVGGV
jgi:hypothetical protein